MYKNRIESIDLFRIIAITAVIVIHTVPFKDSSPIGHQLNLATTLNQLARFAVPFFFILSGFFWGQKVERIEQLKETTVAMAKRILFLFFIWSVIYLLPTNLLASFDFGILGPVKKFVWNLNSAASRPFNTLIQGTKQHLWYLMGLFCSLSISAILIWHRRKTLLLLVAITLYVIGLAGGAYSVTPFGFQSEFNFRNGPFFSLIFFATGYFLQRKILRQSGFGAACSLPSLGVFCTCLKYGYCMPILGS